MAIQATPIPNPRRSYVAVTVTLTSANTPYNLYTLVQAVVSAQTPPSNAPAACRELNIQGYAGNNAAGTGANTDVVLIGDSFISSSNFGFSLSVGGSRTYRSSSTSSVPLGTIYAQSPTAGQKLNLEIETA